jgi:radical SAM protein with 4Fe4S-binding SPASM domain
MEYINSMRILLTENCNANCAHCFNKDIRNKTDADTERTKVLFDYLANHVETLKIMGGEPTIHPDFLELYRYAQKKFHRVSLFTNAASDKIRDIKPREQDVIDYNLALVGEGFDFSKLLPACRFSRYFETMVGSNTDMDALLSKIRRVADECKKRGVEDTISFCVTLNCVENIFEKKEVLNRKWLQTVTCIHEINPKFLSFDHKIPLCFWTKETLNAIKKLGLPNRFFNSCEPGDYGLINSNFELLHCNQHPIYVAKIFKSDETDSPIISFNRLNTLLFKSNMKKLLSNLDNGCVNCEHAVIRCTGGCFMHKYVKQQAPSKNR